MSLKTSARDAALTEFYRCSDFSSKTCSYLIKFAFMQIVFFYAVASSRVRISAIVDSFR